MILRLFIFFVSTLAAFHLFADHSGNVPAIAEAHPLETRAENREARNADKSDRRQEAVKPPKKPAPAKPALPKAAPKRALDSKYDYQLSMPTIGVSAPVLGLGKTPDGSKMAVPDNFSEVSWYNLGPRPGEIGNSVLGAHVDNGGSIPGVFKNLKNLKIGDAITMTDQSGKVLKFTVRERKIYDYKTEDTGEVFGSNGKPRIVLITCFGNFLPAENTYDKRLVIFAE